MWRVIGAMQYWGILAYTIFVTAAAAWFCWRRSVTARLAADRLRSRIAADLHDDIGPGLSQLALLSQLAGREMNDPGVGELLDRMGEICRTLSDSLNGIVLSVDSGPETLAGTVRRMRRFAADISSSNHIRLRFETLGEVRGFRAAAGVWRNLFLIFKEALHNVIRHSRCTEVGIELSVERDSLVLTIADNGEGFDPESVHAGCGLDNMRRRARNFGGDLAIVSGAAGTVVTARIPLRNRARRQKPVIVLPAWLPLTYTREI